MQFFAQAGFPCPALRNPSDHFLRCINSDFDKVKATLKGSMKLRVSTFISLCLVFLPTLVRYIWLKIDGVFFFFPISES